MTFSHPFTPGEPAPASNATHPSLRRRLNVLLVEDEPQDADLLSELLQRSRRFACTITLASDLTAGRAALDVGQFDLSILDYWVGAEPSLRLLDHPAHLAHGLPALLVSSIDVIDVRGAGLAAGARAYLHKNALSTEALDTAILSALMAANDADEMVGPAGLEPATRPL